MDRLIAECEPALISIAKRIYKRGIPTLDVSDLVQLGWRRIIRLLQDGMGYSAEELLRRAENLMKARLRTERRRLHRQEPLTGRLIGSAGEEVLGVPRLDLRSLIREAKLQKRERAVILAVYRDGLSLKEAGEVLGEGRVYEIHQVALRRLAPVLADHLVCVLRVSAKTCILERSYWGKPVWRHKGVDGWKFSVVIETMPSHPEYEKHIKAVETNRQRITAWARMRRG